MLCFHLFSLSSPSTNPANFPPPEINSHLRYTIPPAIALTYGYRPLCTVLDVYKLLFLMAVCFSIELIHIPDCHAHSFSRRVDRSRLYHAMGLVSYPHPNLDLSIHCHHWPHTLSHSSRGNLLLCHSNI